MSISDADAKVLLQEHSLRITAPRLAVLRVLAEARGPLSHTEVLEILGTTSWDPATIYRNLVKLREAEVAVVVSRADGIDRYALINAGDDGHQHPHFVCTGCGRIACLPTELTASLAVDGPWADSVQNATLHLRGECPDCIGKPSNKGG